MVHAPQLLPVLNGRKIYKSLYLRLLLGTQASVMMQTFFSLSKTPGQWQARNEVLGVMSQLTFIQCDTWRVKVSACI